MHFFYASVLYGYCVEFQKKTYRIEPWKKSSFSMIHSWWSEEQSVWISRLPRCSVPISQQPHGIQIAMTLLIWDSKGKSSPSVHTFRSDSSDSWGWSGSFFDQVKSSENTIRYSFPMRQYLVYGELQHERKPHIMLIRYLVIFMINTMNTSRKYQQYSNLCIELLHLFSRKYMNKSCEK